MIMSEYKSVQVTKGRGGWGGPLTITPTDERPLVASITGGGIHPVAQKIADLTGAEAVDGFSGGGAPFDKLAVAVIDCGGTARVGVYPMKKVKTVDIHATSPAGPLAMFITEDLFVSGVGTEEVQEA
jgi:PTS system glucitol/sorbitol-specific IIB component